MITYTMSEVNDGKKINKPVIPSARRLHESLKRFVKMIDKVRNFWELEVQRLIHVDDFLKLLLKKIFLTSS